MQMSIQNKTDDINTVWIFNYF